MPARLYVTALEDTRAGRVCRRAVTRMISLFAQGFLHGMRRIRAMAGPSPALLKACRAFPFASISVSFISY